VALHRREPYDGNVQSTLQISASALSANFAAVRAVAACEVLGVVKANAYGHGAALCAPVLVQAGARWLGVTDAEEGTVVRQALRDAGFADDAVSVLVMVGISPLNEQVLRAVVRESLTPVVWSVEQVQALEAVARAARKPVAVHVEIDTGMNRQGVVPGPALQRVLEALRGCQRVRVSGLMSHLACAEVQGATQTAAARRLLQHAVEAIVSAGMRPEWLHLENTSAVDEGSSAAFLRSLGATAGAKPMVRSGLGLYGYALPLEGTDPAPACDAGGSTTNDVKTLATSLLQPLVTPVMRWVTRVVDVREIAPGAELGYGASFVAERAMRVALLPVGYADGFRREASSGLARNGERSGWVMLAGQRAPVVGRVSMNLTMVDVTAIQQVQAGSEAVLLGPGVSAEDHAAWAGTIAYEIVCGVCGRRELVA
jgi:alanine racemase